MMFLYRFCAAAVMVVSLAACASNPEPPPVASCPPGRVMTYAAGCVTPDRNSQKPKGDYVPYKPLKAKATAMTGEEDTNPFRKTGAQAIDSKPK